MDINAALNEVFVKVFKNITGIEERVIQTGEYQNATANDMHVIETIGIGKPKNMTSVAKALSVTTGTLTISVNSLVKKGFVERVRSESDRRVVLVSLTEKGRMVYLEHQKFHEDGIYGRNKDGLSRSNRDCLFFGESYFGHIILHKPWV